MENGSGGAEMEAGRPKAVSYAGKNIIAWLKWQQWRWANTKRVLINIGSEVGSTWLVVVCKEKNKLKGESRSFGLHNGRDR